MRYGIMINLDYDAHSYEDCHALWQRIRNAMVDAGFRIEGRLFTIQMSPDEACELARSVMDTIDAEQPEIDVYTYFREFYGNDHSSTINLLLPPSDNIQIDEH
jgi:hypothetical protein